CSYSQLWEILRRIPRNVKRLARAALCGTKMIGTVTDNIPMATTSMKFADGVEILGAVTPAYSEILTPEAMRFLANLARGFEPTRQERLAARVKKQAELDAGALPDFPPETAEIRAKSWTVAPIPKDLEDRRVEITGPVDRKMLINALNSGANVFMADFED